MVVPEYPVRDAVRGAAGHLQQPPVVVRRQAGVHGRVVLPPLAVGVRGGRRALAAAGGAVRGDHANENVLKGQK